ncbi:MAG: hypothetical protein N3A62_04070, partial [Thermodesulfovibrionales bacterium]|nr:hypothetical protein [Thermodesulfovibrionales bacterium]
GSIIDNMPYKCGDKSGRTGRLGNFTYTPGQDCTFSLGKMNFTVSPINLLKGYVSVYDMVSTKEEAWTLMAIMQSISHTRPIPQDLKSQLPDDFVLVIDNNLERRIPAVDLKKGDAAVEEALKTFAGTVKAVKVADARKKLGQTLNEDGTLKESRDDIVNKMRALLDALGLHEESGKQWKPKNGQKMTYHDNIVNLRFYDAYGNPLAVSNFTWQGVTSPTGIVNQIGWAWITAGQYPSGWSIKLGPQYTTISGYNIIGFDFYSGRSASNYVGTSFQYAAMTDRQTRDYYYSTGTTPKTIYAYGTKDVSKKTSFPQQLNFGFNVQITGTVTKNLLIPQFATNYNILCDSIMLGQGSSTPTADTWLELAEKIGDTALSIFGAVSEEGANIGEDVEAIYDVVDLMSYAIVNLPTQNWWIFTSDKTIAQWQFNYRGFPANFRLCQNKDRIGQPDEFIGMIIYSSYDDHTFDIVLVFLGDQIQGFTIY